MKTYNERTVSILQKAKVQRRKLYTLRVGICSIFVLLVVASINIVPLFTPYDTNPPSVEQYADSDYYSIIEKLNLLTYEKPRYKNAFEEYVIVGLQNFLSSALRGPSGGASAPNGAEGEFENGNGGASSQAPMSSESYEEVTDNQVAGIIEGDRIKRSSEYIYYMNKQTLSVYSIAGLDSKMVGSFDIVDKDGYSFSIYADEWEMFLSSDCKTITLITSALCTETYERNVALISIDVSDPANIKEIQRSYLTGSYISSRMVDGDILLISHYNAGLKGINFDDPTSFVPQYGSAENMKCIDASCIIVPDELQSTQYTVVCKIDGTTLESKSAGAFLSYSEDIYVSTNHVYATRNYTNITEDEDGITHSEAMTEISALNYSGEKITISGGISVIGRLKDQYSMDEHEGTLRVVTTTDSDKYRKHYERGYDYSAQWIENISSETNASLYCIDLNNWQIIASVEKFAPKNETVQSVRFDKNYAYVCTAVTMTMSDPVFYFDLSDLSNITYKDTGTITGYSISLINFGDYLLGIGYGETRDDLKIELYQETETGVASVCTYDVINCSFSTVYKSYYIDRTNLRFGLGYSTHAWDDANDYYVLLQFDGYEFVELIKEEITGNNDYKRAVCIDGYLYMFGENFVVKEI